LFVTGNTRHSATAIVNIRRICEEHLHGRCDLKILDLLREPSLAAGELIVAAPTLVRKLPLPECRLIGDLSQTDRVLAGLGLSARASAPSPATAVDSPPR
jgi:circadian clock protein KaiB